MSVMARPWRGGVPLNPRTALSDLIARVFSAPFAEVFDAPLGGAAVAALPWYLEGGIALSDVAGVWQPKGAASLASSYLRIAGNQGYADIDPAVVGGVAPTFDPTTGWDFSPSPIQYLITGIVPALPFTFVMQYSDSTTTGPGYTFTGAGLDSGNRFYIGLYNNQGDHCFFIGSGYQLNATNSLSGVIALVGQSGANSSAGYFNGLISGSAFTAGNSTTRVMEIGRLLFGADEYALDAKVQRVAMYSIALNAAQHLALATAILAS